MAIPKHRFCTHCKDAFFIEPNTKKKSWPRYIYDRYCKRCDLYYCSRWSKNGYSSFLDTEKKGWYIRQARTPSRLSLGIDKPAPYCLVRYHDPQIVVDSDFHSYFEDVKARLTQYKDSPNNKVR